MARKKNQLPESLELLLDTMCNTFGAIMFIAISLVIISQVMTRIVRERMPIEITEEYLDELREKVQSLEDELQEEERKMAERALVALGMPKEKKEKVEALLAVKSENQRLVLALARQEAEKEKALQEKNEAENMLEETETEIRQMQVETAQKERLVEQMRLANQQRKEALQQQVANAKAVNQALETKSRETQGQTLTFSMEVSTSNEKQYLICLKNGRLFCEKAGEISPVSLDDDSGYFRFVGNGHAISNHPQGEFNRLLVGLSTRNFVTIFSDRKSYPLLVELRKYLRTRRVKVNFIHTEEFDFSYGDSKASY